MNRRPKAQGYVYIAAQIMGGLVKIGHSIWPTTRAREVGHNRGLTVLVAMAPGTKADEKRVHAMFPKQLREGKEWFLPDKEMLKFIIYVRRHKLLPSSPQEKRVARK